MLLSFYLLPCETFAPKVSAIRPAVGARAGLVRLPEWSQALRLEPHGSCARRGHQEDSHATNSAAQLLDRFGASSEALKGLVWILWLGRCSMAQIGAARPISCTATLRRLAAPCARAERVDLMCWLRRRQWRAVRLRTSWRLRTRADVAGVVCVIEVYTRGVRLVTFFASARLPETRTEPARRNLRSAGFATQGRRYCRRGGAPSGTLMSVHT